ncbi:MAG: hypothetical protein GEV03_05320 [Streptosporangiales bacterium]|nr:hypothetical protein [Streptosporangiales bacterium]
MRSQFHAENVGSLLRPAELLSARADHGAGRIDDEALRKAEDHAIERAIELQREVGLEIYSDGEYRRLSFLSTLADAVDGFTDGHSNLAWRGDDSQEDRRSTAKVVGAPIQQRRRLSAHEVPFLAANAPGPYKATVPDPTHFTIASWQAGISDRAYPRRTDLLPDLTRIVRAEVETLIADGVPYVQLDAPGLTLLCDERVREQLSADGTDPDALLDACIEADRACVEGLSRDGVTIAMHLCRGNSRGRWIGEAGYDRLAAKLFQGVPVDTWLLEYDTERAGDFTPLRHMPRGVTVVLGLISTKTPRLEDPDDLARRIEEAARYVPAEDLALSPQCGFASIASGNPVTWDDQRRKLELTVNTARLVWG